MAEGEKLEKTGRCLCGAVTVTATAVDPHVHACHCAMCRRWNGGPAMASNCGTTVEIAGAENVTAYRSSAWAERAFCKTCGTNLFYRVVESDELIVNVGIFDDQSGLELAGEIFVDEQPGWYGFAGERNRMTGAEVFAMFAPKEDEA
jgi:hypothetical protein